MILSGAIAALEQHLQAAKLPDLDHCTALVS